MAVKDGEGTVLFSQAGRGTIQGQCGGQQEDGEEIERPVAFVSIKAQQAGLQRVYGSLQARLTLIKHTGGRDGGDVLQDSCINSLQGETYSCPLIGAAIFSHSNGVPVVTRWVFLSDGRGRGCRFGRLAPPSYPILCDKLPSCTVTDMMNFQGGQAAGFYFTIICTGDNEE